MGNSSWAEEHKTLWGKGVEGVAKEFHPVIPHTWHTPWGYREGEEVRISFPGQFRPVKWSSWVAAGDG